jgi:hypothetical protein
MPDSSYYYEAHSGCAAIDTRNNTLSLDVDGARIDELRTLLSRGLNTWERAPEWLLKLAEIVDK